MLPFIQLTVNATGFVPDDSDFDEGFVSIQFPQPFYFNNLVYNSASVSYEHNNTNTTEIIAYNTDESNQLLTGYMQ